MDISEFTPEDIARFWSKVAIPPNNSSKKTCWIWTDSVNKQGYGQFHVGKRENHRNYAAHRVSFVLANGFVSKDLYVCHRCDIRCCVRPDHLFEGTAAQNTHDAVSKGRFNRGIAIHNAVLTEEAVRDIRSRWHVRPTLQSLSDEYGVRLTTIHGVVTNRTWKHIK